MTATLDTRPARVDIWAELPRLAQAARHHVERHPELSVASIDVFTTDLGPGRVEIYVCGDLPLSCLRLLAWWDTLAGTSACLEIEDDPQQPKAMLFGRLQDGTQASLVAPLAEEHVIGVDRTRIGDWVLDWLRAHAVATT
ncbi:hypothetical protein [Actinokineospora globicatena]|uniref:hypothetical protein n=1 Tax=Actinokineospora globicatena TaxID=103729 RepID=UPI0020A4C375|nr:hypothetical protein [Actinokineospora globicatena]MCP2304999.1 hypothetical protein [Actinokineospora globicatena]GLW80461.1 hypothetical protein Aglo01_49420 [Actinokineospora globicatena]GLW87289.1 hypothetical protein Aglo02_49280 [Actinokineospora globicatena]